MNLENLQSDCLSSHTPINCINMKPAFYSLGFLFSKSSQREGVCLVSRIRMRKEIWFFKDGIRVQTPGFWGSNCLSLCLTSHQ